MAGTTITQQAEEMVYNMDTGEMAPKKKAMDAIAEDEEDQD